METGQGQVLQFSARWIAKKIVAEINPADPTNYRYHITEEFIPVSELSRPYGLNAEVADNEAQNFLLASDSVDLISSYTGYNLDMTRFVMQPNSFTYRLFDASNLVAEGDCMLILTKQF